MPRKALRHIILEGGKITAQYELTIGNKVDIKTKDSAWPSGVTSAASSLIAAANALYEGVATITKIQLYTPLSDTADHPPHSSAGDIVDLDMTNADGTKTSSRWGDDEAVDASLIGPRDAVKAAVSAAL